MWNFSPDANDVPTKVQVQSGMRCEFIIGSLATGGGEEINSSSAQKPFTQSNLVNCRA